MCFDLSSRVPLGMVRIMRVLATVVAALTTALVLGGPPAGASGPALDVPVATLAAALHCHGRLGEGPRPVLLVPGTTLNPDVNFDWNYEPAFSSAGRAWCAVTVPVHGMGDVQVAAEYVVYALRTMSARAGRRVSVVGYSQGGMSPRWALKWWPDTRGMVDDLISIDGSNHGTLDTVPLCLLRCAPSIWQQDYRSRFLASLNAGQETYAGISYTQLYSAFDEVVVPNLGPAASTALHTGPGAIANISVQAVCPLHLAEHVTMGTVDPVAYALVLDALTHSGPAAASRVPHAVCSKLLMPGVTPATAFAGELRVGAQAASSLANPPRTAAEPALAGYVH
jgi:triacylglycerol esterase/lipase EstA (alpha/beta hydrolase family)